jgi:hypothetical protein
MYPALIVLMIILIGWLVTDDARCLWVAAVFGCGYLLGERDHDKASVRVGGGGSHTYALDSTLVPDSFLDKYLSGWEQVAVKSRPKYVDFVLCLSGGSHLLYGTRARLKSRTDSLEITDKVNLHAHMAKLCPHAIARTVEIDPDTTLPDGAVWMVRANWGWKGRASSVATTTEELQRLRAKFSVLPPDWRKPTLPRVIGSEYIRDPLLWKGFKFHVRVHVVAVVFGGTREPYAVMLPTIEMIAAGKPFVNADYGDEDIHDTHDARNILTGVLHKDIPEGAQLIENTVALFKEAIPPLLPLLKLYPESENAYDIFGVDVMYREDLSPVILEINSTPGMIDDPTSPLLYINDEVTNAIFCTGFSDLFGAAGDESQIIRL